MREIVLLLALLATLLVSGCVAEPRSSVTILVTDEPGGPPVEGVEVTMVKAGIFAGYRDRGVTGPDGTVRFRAPDLAIAQVAHPGFVAEGTRIHTDAGTRTVPMYRERIDLDVNATLVGADVSTHGSPVERWDPHELGFGRDATAQRGYAARAYSLNATLSWNTTLLSGAGDLALALGSSTERADVWVDEERQLAPGAHTESVHLTRADFSDAEWNDLRTLYGGAAPGSAYASPTGIPYHLHVEARFAQRLEGPNAPVGAIIALAATALLVRRRRATSVST